MSKEVLQEEVKRILDQTGETFAIQPAHTELGKAVRQQIFEEEASLEQLADVCHRVIQKEQIEDKARWTTHFLVFWSKDAEIESFAMLAAGITLMEVLVICAKKSKGQGSKMIEKIKQFTKEVYPKEAFVRAQAQQEEFKKKNPHRWFPQPKLPQIEKIQLSALPSAVSFQKRQGFVAEATNENNDPDMEVPMSFPMVGGRRKQTTTRRRRVKNLKSRRQRR